MPLDGSTYLTDWQLKQLADLDRLDAWFCDESRWCKGTIAINLLIDDTTGAMTADRTCLLGAFRICNATHATHQNITAIVGNVPAFNDNPRTTFSDIKTLIQRVRESVLAGRG
jgi:hypothetical protein